ncbi:MAG: nuclear transport factor 2 family protein [Lapillicoccus sp.]
MTVESTTRVMDDYLDALAKREDFSRFFADDIVWTTTETSDTVRGREAVRDFIVAFHTQTFEASMDVKALTVCDGHATLEADFVGQHAGEFAGIAATGARLRVPYCVCYDVDDSGITALRAYLPIAKMVSEVTEAAEHGVPAAP